MALPVWVRYVSNLRGPAGKPGPAGTFTSVSAESVPSGQPAEAIQSGPPEARQVLFRIPQGLPGGEGIAGDEAVAGYIGSPGSQSSTVLHREVGTGINLLFLSGQSLAGGTQATAVPSLDYDFEGITWWGCTPGEAGFHQINAFTSLPLAGGLIEERPYGLMGALVTARMWYQETGVPVLIVPVFAGGTGFRSHNTIAARWLVSEDQYPNLAHIALDEMNLAIQAARQLGPIRDVMLIWNQGEADRDVSVSESTHAGDLDDLYTLWRGGLLLERPEELPIILARQLPERRAVDGPGKAGVDRAQLDTPRRVPYSAVVHPPAGYARPDNTHATAAGQRVLGRLYYEAFKRARLNRPSMAGAPVENLHMDGERLRWESPSSGRNEGLSVRYRTSGTGAFTEAAVLEAGAREIPVNGLVTDGVEATLAVVTKATPGDSEPAEIRFTPRRFTATKVFDFNADTIPLSSNSLLTPGSWVSESGSQRELSFSIISGTAPTVYVDNPNLPGHRMVQFGNGTGGGIATAPDSIYIEDGTYVLLVRPQGRVGDNPGSPLMMHGSGDSQHNIFVSTSTMNFGFRVGPSGGVGVAGAAAWHVIVARKRGLDLWLDVETVAGTRTQAEGTAVSQAQQTLIAISGTAGDHARFQGGFHRLMGFNHVYAQSSVDDLIQQVFEDAGLR